MIRVAHVVSGDLWAGAEVMVYNLLRHLNNQRHLEVFSVLMNEGRLSRELRKLGIKVYVIDENRFSLMNIGCKLYLLLREYRPHIVHSHRYKENILSYGTTRFLNRVKLVTTQHGMPEIFSGLKKPKQSVVTRLNFFLMKKIFDKVVCVSCDIKTRFAQRYGFNPEILAVVHNGINLPNSFNIPDKGGPFCIGTAGRLFPIKDFPLFIKIADKILKADRNVHFLLAGDGPERLYLQKLVDRCRLSDRFKFLGHIENMSTFYKRLDLYLNTSVHEGLPMSILEAMAHGIPVVAPATGGLCEIIEHARNGYLIKSRKPTDYAGVCLGIIDDRNLLKRLSLAARERVVNLFSAQKMAENYYRLYRELVEN